MLNRWNWLTWRAVPLEPIAMMSMPNPRRKLAGSEESICSTPDGKLQLLGPKLAEQLICSWLTGYPLSRNVHLQIITQLEPIKSKKKTRQGQIIKDHHSIQNHPDRKNSILRIHYCKTSSSWSSWSTIDPPRIRYHWHITKKMEGSYLTCQRETRAVIRLCFRWHFAWQSRRTCHQSNPSVRPSSLLNGPLLGSSTGAGS